VTSAPSPCRSTRPSKPSAPIHTSCNCARTSIERIRSARSSHPGTRFPVNFSSGEYFVDIFFIIAPSSQELEPPANPARFSHKLSRPFIRRVLKYHLAKSV
jgi:hypothetical protein